MSTRSPFPAVRSSPLSDQESTSPVPSRFLGKRKNNHFLRERKTTIPLQSLIFRRKDPDEPARRAKPKIRPSPLRGLKLGRPEGASKFVTADPPVYAPISLSSVRMNHPAGAVPPPASPPTLFVAQQTRQPQEERFKKIRRWCGMRLFLEDEATNARDELLPERAAQMPKGIKGARASQVQ